MWVDAAIVALVGLATWRGMRRGLLLSLAGLGGFFAAAASAIFGYRTLARPLDAAGLSRGTASLVAALAIFVAVTMLFWLVGRWLTRAIRRSLLGRVNAVGGGALAALWALSWVAAVVFAITLAPAPRGLERAVERSTLAQAVMDVSPRFVRAVARADFRGFLTTFLGEPDRRDRAGR